MNTNGRIPRLMQITFELQGRRLRFLAIDPQTVRSKLHTRSVIAVAVRLKKIQTM